ncbi:hypothetical protein BX666DRAFT_1903559 [Dichotomocladium elegans]|nr:hypothetical protein BX666DRAFT_1903559 [Dichotomocladium elegans]
MFFKSTLTVLATMAVAALACEPECRHGVAHAFAENYVPVVRIAVDDLRDTFTSSLFNATFPAHVAAIVPEPVLRNSVSASISETLDVFVDKATGSTLESGIFSVMFSEEKPFKGDCNNPPRLTRKMPPAGESWTLEECAKMDYICGNPPSVCYFIDEIKQRINRRIITQLQGYANHDSGELVQSIIQAVKQTTHAVMYQYGAGSMIDDPRVTMYIDILTSNAIESLDIWASKELLDICVTEKYDHACNSWTEDIKPEILKWP